VGVVAAPDYLKAKSEIREPLDLVSHDGISFTPRNAQMRWNLRSGKRQHPEGDGPRFAVSVVTPLSSGSSARPKLVRDELIVAVG
jgi:hypothetical protein